MIIVSSLLLAQPTEIDELEEELSILKQQVAAQEYKVNSTELAILAAEERMEETTAIDYEYHTLLLKIIEYTDYMRGLIDASLEDILAAEHTYEQLLARKDFLYPQVGYKVPDAQEVYDFDVYGTIMQKEIRLEELLSPQLNISSSVTNGSTSSGLLEVSRPLEIESLIITSPYGYRTDPVTGAKGVFHHGIDFRAPSGTPCIAMQAGVVLDTGYNYSLGYYVRLRSDSDGSEWLYGHLSSFSVSIGQHVYAGDTIALSGNTGAHTTGPHLHLGYYVDDSSRDFEHLLDIDGRL